MTQMLSSFDRNPVALSDEEIVARGRAIIQAQQQGLEILRDAIDGSLARAVELVALRSGRFVVTGVGKSGHIGAKLAATFASTGTPSFFLHSAEAAHGDLGMITRDDTVLALSNSGNSSELIPIIDYCAARSIPIIAICGNPGSRLGKAATVLLKLPAVQEVCPNNLAPTTSATLTLVTGHLLAVLLMEARRFTDTEFAEFHPGGRLGRLLQTVRRYTEEFPDEVPTVGPDAKMETVISSLASGRKGCVVVVSPEMALLGIITEGDLRRAYAPDMFSRRAEEVMTRTPASVGPDELMRTAVAALKERRISNIVVAEAGKVIDVLHVKDLMQRGFL